MGTFIHRSRGAGAGFQLIGTISANSSPFSYPAGMQAGDIVILAMTALDTGDDSGDIASATMNTPTGYTSVATAGDSGIGGGVSTASHGRLVYRVADGTEGASRTYSLTGNNSRVRGVVLRLGGQAVSAAAYTATLAGNSTVSSATIAASGGTPPIVAVGCLIPNDTSPDSIAMSMDGEGSENRFIWKGLTSAANVTFDATGDPATNGTTGANSEFIAGFFELTV